MELGIESLVKFTVLSVVFFLVLRIIRSYFGKQSSKLSDSIPLVPSKYPLSHLVELLSSAPWDVMLEWMRKYGPVIKFHFIDTYIVVSDPGVIKHIFTTNLPNYLKDRGTYKPFLVLLGTGLVTSEGELWKKQRKLIASAFRIEILAETANIAFAAADRLTQKLKKTNGKRIEIAEEFRRLTLQVIGEAVLSLHPEESDRVFPSLYLPIVQEANKRTWYPFRQYLPLPSTFAFNSAVKELNRFVSELILKRFEVIQQEKLAESGRKLDILDRIIEAVEEEPFSEATVTQLRDEIKTFIFAGHETTSTMLTWALYQLTLNPECLQKVKEEADAVFGPESQMPDYKKLRDMPYTTNVLKETLRLYSVVPVVTRETVEDDRVDDYFIPSGSKICIHIKALHHREDLWPEPKKFKPERFDEKYDAYAWIPFINGPRACLGQPFAMLEAKIVLGLLVQRFRFAPSAGNVGKWHPYEIPVCPVDNMLMDIEGIL